MPTLLSIRNSKLMNFPLSPTSDRTGLTRSSSLTLKNVTVKRSVPSAAAVNATSLTNALVRIVALPNLSSTRITVRKTSSSVRFVIQGSLRRKAASVKPRCPHCGNILVPKKNRKHFIVYKCVNPKCPYYLHNLKKVDKKDLEEAYGKNKYKLHYIYREFTVDFFSMDLNTLPKNASSLKFSKHNTHVMSLCLTLHVNLGLSLRKTSQALKDLYNISISHQQIANYCKTAAICIKPFVDQYPYEKGCVHGG